MPRPPAPLFSILESLDRISKLAVVRQGEPTIVVAVFQYVARVHGRHQGGSRRQLQPPIATYHGHTQATCPLFFLPGVSCQTLSTLSSKQDEKGGEVGLGMADVCCDWHWQMPPVASVVCSMVPSNVLKHCHNNGWLSLPHHSQFAKLCQHSPASRMKKGAK